MRKFTIFFLRNFLLFTKSIPPANGYELGIFSMLANLLVLVMITCYKLATPLWLSWWWDTRFQTETQSQWFFLEQNRASRLLLIDHDALQLNIGVASKFLFNRGFYAAALYQLELVCEIKALSPFWRFSRLAFWYYWV